MIYSNHNAFASVKEMVESVYKLDGDLYFGYNVDNKNHLRPFGDMLRESKHAGRKVILYQLEQLMHGSYWLNPQTIARLKYADEIWEYDIDNISFLKDELKISTSVKFRPMLYSNAVVIPLSENRDIDILFYGGISDRRKEILTYLQRQLGTIKITFVENVWGKELNSYISRSKIILNIHNFEYNRQEQVRIFPLVSSGCCVVSEFSERNYFGNCIYNVPLESMSNVIKNILYTNTWKSNSDIIKRKFISISQYHMSKFIT